MVKLNRLLTELTLGDCASSQLLREKEQLGGDKVKTELLQSLWLQRLPKRTQTILACADSGSLDTLAVIADKIHEVHVRPMVGEVSRDNSSQVAQLQQMVAALTATVSELAEAVGALRGGSRTRSRSRSASRNGRSVSKSSGPSASVRICWYHLRFA